MSGTAKMAEKYGGFFTWSGSPRAKIFARDHSMVNDIPSMVKLMRWEVVVIFT